ncbi:ROK family transcriptional regulator [Flavimaricola marinus]|uniref:N-acetylglucosamine repressor n=1 Tax=Flavimaricola marinus TaxID=1819565 RepID=A0A238LKS2_9RHOB|nr:ROK family transcriptional regulator [Flavimaricola marinus]SMY10289.1 N-acetylglucosamine repressor [Flavimaricola marinus]
MSIDPDRRVAGTDRALVAPRDTIRLQVLDCIRQTGEIARTDIATRVGVSPATVTAITVELLGAGLIEPVPTDAFQVGAKRGRPREALRLKANAKLIAGMKVGWEAITVLLSDFCGNVLGSIHYPIARKRLSAPDLADLIIAAKTEACAQLGMSVDDVSVMSIGLAGHIDGASGHVHWSSAMTERNVDFCELLSTRATCPVFIENDANLVAKAEHLFGEGRNCDDFIVITLEHGIGMGIMIDGALYRGARGCGAEFGHTKVTLDGALCQCGQHGCLEAYAGEYALLDGANMGGNGPYPNLTALTAAADRGDQAAGYILDRAGRFFAMALANLINVFDPELLILAIKDSGPHPLCQSSVLDRVNDMVIQVDAPPPRIIVHGWGDLIWAKGAAAAGIEKVSELAVRQLGAT